MSLPVTCTSCNVQLVLRDDQESTVLRCPKCGGHVKVTHPKPERRPRPAAPATQPPGGKA